MSYSDCGLDGHSNDELYTCLQCFVDEVANDERERIIRLIHEYSKTVYDSAVLAGDLGGKPTIDIEKWKAIQNVIALIEGENE